MAEHPVIMDQKQIKLTINRPGQSVKKPPAESVVQTAPKVAEGKKTLGQRLSGYAFGEEVAEPGKYVWKSYLEPTGKRVANDIVEYFLTMLKHTFQRWIWNGKTLDDGKLRDRTSFSNYYGQGQEPIKARVMMSPVKELTFATRLDAERVLNHLKGVIQNDNAVTVREYYESGGCPELCGDGTASSSGWENLNKVEIKEQPDGSGFTLSLPRPVNLSKK